MSWRCAERGAALCAALLVIALSAGCAASARLGEAASPSDDLPRALASLRGTPFVLAPFFTSCTVRCPLTIEKLRRFSETLERHGVHAAIVLFTIDPRNDDEARLERFRAERHLPRSWRILRGPPEETRALSRALGAHVAPDDTHIDHDVRIALFDAAGRPVRTFTGWDFDEDEAADLLSRAAAPPFAHSNAPCPQLPEGTRFDALFSFVRQTNVRSVDALVAALPASLRSRYVLMRESRSAQEASDRDPRALLYSEDASFVLAFNGTAAQTGGRAVETLEFDACTRSFRLRELSFSDDGAPIATEVNPRRCRACHGEDPRPIWDAYPLWPGAIGEVEGAANSERRHDRAALASLSRAAEGASRYHPLLGLDAFLAPSTDRAHAFYEGVRTHSRNADFGAKLERLEERAIARRVLDTARFWPFRYALLASLDPQCVDIESYVPADVRAGFGRTARRFHEESEDALAREDRSKAVRLTAPVRVEEPFVREALTDFRYLVEEGLRLPAGGWAMSLTPDDVDFSTGGLTGGEIERALFAAVASEEADLARLRADPDHASIASGGYCTRLRRASLQSLEGLSAAPLFEPRRKP